MKAFPFSLKDDEVVTPFSTGQVILFAIQIRSLFGTVHHLPREELLFSLARIFTGCKSHWEENDNSREHTAGKLPHNHIFFELVVVACGSIIETFCELGYLIIEEHKTGGREIRVDPDYQDGDELMIIPTQDVLLEHINLPSTTISPDSVVSDNTLSLTGFRL
jgi:hypothetical protein